MKNSKSSGSSMKKGKGMVAGQPGTMNMTRTGKAGSAGGLSSGTEGAVVRMGGKKLK